MCCVYLSILIVFICYYDYAVFLNNGRIRTVLISIPYAMGVLILNLLNILGYHLRWTRDRSRVNWEKIVCYQVRANETYSEAASV